jgi:hypothetical protein
MSLIHSFHNQRYNFFNILNTPNIILIPKKEGGDTVNDFRPISLIHAIAKIMAKLLALRLQPFMNWLVSNSQSAFIKGRSIHDNFMYDAGDFPQDGEVGFPPYYLQLPPRSS